jgi:hypothetical protein
MILSLGWSHGGLVFPFQIDKFFAPLTRSPIYPTRIRTRRRPIFGTVARVSLVEAVHEKGTNFGILLSQRELIPARSPPAWLSHFSVYLAS